MSIGHVSPEAAAGGTIALVENGDTITIDVPNRTIRLEVPSAALDERRTRLEAAGGHQPIGVPLSWPGQTSGRDRSSP